MTRRLRVRDFAFVWRMPRRKEIVFIAATGWRSAILKRVLVLSVEEIFMHNSIVYAIDNLVREPYAKTETAASLGTNPLERK